MWNFRSAKRMKNQKQQGELLVSWFSRGNAKRQKEATFLNPRLCSGGCVIKSSSITNSRIYSESQGLQIARQAWKANETMENLHSSFQNLLQSCSNQTVWCWHEDTHRATEQNGEPRGLPLHQATLDKDTVTTHSCLPEFSGGSHHITQSTASSQPQRIQKATLVASMTSSPLSL